MKKNRILIIALSICIISISAIYMADTPKGADLFRSEGCIECHTINGRGGKIGPDLTSVTERRSAGWIKDQIKEPRSHNPSSRMPSFSHLSWMELRALTGYLKEHNGK